MPKCICTTCGTQYAESDQPPLACTICQDERQYVKKTGSVVQPEKTAGKAGEMRPAERQSCLADHPGYEQAATSAGPAKKLVDQNGPLRG